MHIFVNGCATKQSQNNGFEPELFCEHVQKFLMLANANQIHWCVHEQATSANKPSEGGNLKANSTGKVLIFCILNPFKTFARTRPFLGPRLVYLGRLEEPLGYS